MILPVILDANPLALISLVAGGFDTDDQLARAQTRTGIRGGFEEADRLVRFINSHADLIISAPAVGEAGNLIGRLKGDWLIDARDGLARTILDAREHQQPCSDIVPEASFSLFGIADAGLLSAAKALDAALVTDDGRLADFAARSEIQTYSLFRLP